MHHFPLPVHNLCQRHAEDVLVDVQCAATASALLWYSASLPTSSSTTAWFRYHTYFYLCIVSALRHGVKGL